MAAIVRRSAAALVALALSSCAVRQGDTAAPPQPSETAASREKPAETGPSAPEPSAATPPEAEAPAADITDIRAEADPDAELAAPGEEAAESSRPTSTAGEVEDVADAPVPDALRPPVDEERRKRAALAAVLERGGAAGDELTAPLEAAFDSTIVLYARAFEEAERLDADERAALLAWVAAEIRDDIAFYEARELEGVVLRMRYELGRAHALAGDVDRASREGFDPIIALATDDLDAQAAEWIGTLKLYAHYTKAKALLDAGRLEGCIASVDAFLDGRPDALDTDQGNAAMLFKAEALARRDPPDLEAASRAAIRVVERAKGAWPNNARRLIARFDVTARGGRADRSDLSPMARLQGAIGEYQSALDEEDEGRRAEHFERAVEGFERAIEAAEAGDVPLRDRVHVGSKAWFDLGVCYSRMELWYEAEAAFEAVMTRFAKARVGRMLADEGEFAEALARIRREVAARNPPGFGDRDPVDPYELLFDEAAKGPEWSEVLLGLDARLRKSAGNRIQALGHRHRDSGAEFDRKRYHDAAGIDVDPSKRRDLDFHLGLFARQEAEGFAKAGKPREAVGKWKDAAGLFFKAAGTNEARRALAYHLAGECLFEAMKATLVLAADDPGRRAEAERLGRESARAFDAFLNEPQPDLREEEAAKVEDRRRSAAEAKAEIERLLGPARDE